MAAAVERGADGADLPVHHPAGRDDVRAGVGLGHRRAGVALDGRVVVDHTVGGEHAAVPVVGVLVEAAVGHHDQPVTDLLAHIAERQLNDPARVPRLRALAVLVQRHPEEDHRRHAERGQLGHLLAQALAGVLHDAWERGDRLGLVDPLPDEQGRDEVVDREAGLGHEATERGRGAKAAGSVLGEAHEAMLRPDRTNAQPGSVRAATAAASASRETSSRDVTIRSAALTSWPTVSGPGQATVYSPAATADATPVAESSNATDRVGRAPSRRQAARNGSGWGLPSATRSIVVTARKWEISPSCSSTPSTHPESELEAMARGMPASPAAAMSVATPGRTTSAASNSSW